MSHPLYNTWRGMVQRCHNPLHPSYKRYGSRGVYVCERWRTSCHAFYEDVGPRPSPGHTLDRRNNRGHYTPDNVRWATKKEQADNSPWPLRIDWKGESRVLIDVGREHGLKPDTVHCRLKDGWDPIKAVTTPLHAETPMRTVMFRGQQRRVSECSDPPAVCKCVCHQLERANIELASLRAKVAADAAVIAMLGDLLDAGVDAIEEARNQGRTPHHPDFEDMIVSYRNALSDPAVTRAIALDAARREVCEAAKNITAWAAQRGPKRLNEALAKLAELEGDDGDK